MKHCFKRTAAYALAAMMLTASAVSASADMPQLSRISTSPAVLMDYTLADYPFVQRALNQGVVIPSDFVVSQIAYGSMYNNTGSEYYALYMYKDPRVTGSIDLSFGTFCFPNYDNPDTTQFNGSVIFYGYYGEYGLFEHNGEFFWTETSFYHQIGVSYDNTTGVENATAVRTAASAQGIVLPEDFVPSTPIYGNMYNNSGSPFYAVYKVKDPINDNSFDSFCFTNNTDPSTEKYDGSVTMHGTYGSYALFDQNGQYFWAIPDFFHAAKDVTSDTVEYYDSETIDETKGWNLKFKLDEAIFVDADGNGSKAYYTVSVEKNPYTGNINKVTLFENGFEKAAFDGANFQDAIYVMNINSADGTYQFAFQDNGASGNNSTIVFDVKSAKASKLDGFIVDNGSSHLRGDGTFSGIYRQRNESSTQVLKCEYKFVDGSFMIEVK